METFIPNTPDIPDDYIKYTTDITTAVVDDDQSLFYGTSVLSLNYDTEVYIPAVSSGKTITPLTVGGKITGYFSIDGNASVSVLVFYKDIYTGHWFKRNVAIIGAPVVFDFHATLNVEINSSPYVEARIYANAGATIAHTGGDFSNNNGLTWRRHNVSYVEGSTLFRKRVDIGGLYNTVYSFPISINGITKTAVFVTRPPAAPAFSQSSYSFTVNENTENLFTLYPTVSHEGIIALSLSGVDAGLFQISSSGVVSRVGGLDFEFPQSNSGDNNYSLSVIAENDTASTAATVSLSISDLDEFPPELVSLADQTLYENVQGQWQLSISKGTGPTRWYIEEGLDEWYFSIGRNTGLLMLSPRNYEARLDANGDNIYSVVVRAENNFGFGSMTVNVQILNVIEDSIPDPVSYGIYPNRALSESLYVTAVISGMEEGAITTVTGGELSSDGGVTWSNSVIYSPGNTIVRKQIVTSAFYETSTTFSSIVNGVTISGTVRTLNTPVTMIPSRSIQINEHVVTVGSVAATAGYGPISYEIVSGNDKDLFTVNNSGVLSFVIDTDFRDPSDSDLNNIYTLRVRGYNSETEAFTDITIEVLNVILPVQMPTSRLYRFVDTAQAIGTIVPLFTDDIVTFSVSGIDADLIAINPTTGVFSFIDPVVYENPVDSNLDNRYLFNVVLSNALYSAQTSVRVDIRTSANVGSGTDSNIAETIVGASVKHNEYPTTIEAKSF